MSLNSEFYRILELRKPVDLTTFLNTLERTVDFAHIAHAGLEYKFLSVVSLLLAFLISLFLCSHSSLSPVPFNSLYNCVCSSALARACVCVPRYALSLSLIPFF